jgi:feruloyl esterase
MAPTDTSVNGRPINFRVVLPASWTSHAVQLGGGGMNGSIPGLTGGDAAALMQRGFAAYGSDSGHQQGGFGPRGGGAPAATPAGDWSLSDEAIKNLGYAQMKKTRDAAMVLMERIYGERPRYNYYVGSSQGGREALTVAQRYPADYNGIAANVPILNFSSLMLAPEWIRIQEKPLANWVTPAKTEAIRAEFVRQCDKLDGLADGVINNYMACRAIFDMSQGSPTRNPWASKRCPDNVDPNPQDTTANACFTDGQISTLKVVYSRYKFATPLAHGTRTFGMWVPTTDPSGSGLIANARFRSQEGAADNAQNHSHLGVIGVTGFLMKNPAANPLDYVEGGAFNARREEISAWLDSTNPDHQRLPRLSRSATRLLPVRARYDGARRGRLVCPVLRAASDRPRTHGLELHHGWRRPNYRRAANSKPVRTHRHAAGLGGARRRSAQVRHCYGQCGHPAPVFLPDVSAAQRGCNYRRCLVHLR